MSEEGMSVPELEHMEDMSPNMMPSGSSSHEGQRGRHSGESSKLHQRVLMQGDQAPVVGCDQDRLERDAIGTRAGGSVLDEPLRDASVSMDSGMLRPARDVNLAHMQVFMEHYCAALSCF